jgi:hypothetical protein
MRQQFALAATEAQIVLLEVAGHKHQLIGWRHPQLPVGCMDLRHAHRACGDVGNAVGGTRAGRSEALWLSSKEMITQDVSSLGMQYPLLSCCGVCQAVTVAVVVGSRSTLQSVVNFKESAELPAMPWHGVACICADLAVPPPACAGCRWRTPTFAVVHTTVNDEYRSVVVQP